MPILSLFLSTTQFKFETVSRNTGLSLIYILNAKPDKYLLPLKSVIQNLALALNWTFKFTSCFRNS